MQLHLCARGNRRRLGSRRGLGDRAEPEKGEKHEARNLQAGRHSDRRLHRNSLLRAGSACVPHGRSGEGRRQYLPTLRRSSGLQGGQVRVPLAWSHVRHGHRCARSRAGTKILAPDVPVDARGRRRAVVRLGRITLAELTLVSHNLCPYVQRAAIALAEKRVAFARVYVDLSDKPDWFRAISPLGKTPLLKVASGGGEQVIFESAVILEYLEETEANPLH